MFLLTVFVPEQEPEAIIDETHVKEYRLYANARINVLDELLSKSFLDYERWDDLMAQKGDLICERSRRNVLLRREKSGTHEFADDGTRLYSKKTDVFSE
jgi:hypothetical protein